MKKYKACVFDFDLTLADSSKPILKCFKYTLEHFGYPIPSDEKIIKMIGLTLIDGIKGLTGVQDREKLEEMKEWYTEKANEFMAKETKFYPDVLAVLQVLQQAGIKIGIVSLKYRWRIEETFRANTSSFPVDEIIGREDMDRPKPDPFGLRLAMERLGSERETTLYVGDSYIDAMTAQNAGVDFAGVLTGTTSKEEFSEYPSVAIGETILDIVKSL